ncbi:MAG: hypothetical protein K6U14_04080 [Firmicutes bacterium]|nr:hypothetical protein [Alicyclobacillaceae bacterium]MCL6496799.1 hypothetical protein [Bacillota bacterium]
MSLTFVHVVTVVLTTAAGAFLGRAVRNRWRRLQYLNEAARAVLFLIGAVAVVWYVASTPATGAQKAALAGLYLGAVYGLVASDPRPRRRRDEVDEPPEG